MYYGRKRNKYGNKKVKKDDIVFDSIAERDRYIYLKQKEDAGLIKDLQLQVKYLLQEKFIYKGKTIREINYIADFEYIDANGTSIVEDVKGIETAEFKLKAKLFKYKYREKMFYIVKKTGSGWTMD